MAKNSAERQAEISGLFVGDTHVYIDYANIRKACLRLGWRVNLKKLKQMLDATGKVKNVGFYFGTLVGDKGSQGFMARARKEGFAVVTKPVKCMNLSINASSTSIQSPDILRNFISETLIRSLKVEAIQYLNQQLLDLNKLGTLSLEERKCNFDVEIASDMRIDHALGRAQTYCLWSGDSDFAHPILQLLEAGRDVVVISGGVATELNDLRPYGLVIHDIRKLRSLISD
jgi:uncharacterized LabA/DUF88 family protein